MPITVIPAPDNSGNALGLEMINRAIEDRRRREFEQSIRDQTIKQQQASNLAGFVDRISQLPLKEQGDALNITDPKAREQFQTNYGLLPEDVGKYIQKGSTASFATKVGPTAMPGIEGGLQADIKRSVTREEPLSAQMDQQKLAYFKQGYEEQGKENIRKALEFVGTDAEKNAHFMSDYEIQDPTTGAWRSPNYTETLNFRRAKATFNVRPIPELVKQQQGIAAVIGEDPNSYLAIKLAQEAAHGKLENDELQKRMELMGLEEEHYKAETAKLQGATGVTPEASARAAEFMGKVNTSIKDALGTMATYPTITAGTKKTLNPISWFGDNPKEIDTPGNVANLLIGDPNPDAVAADISNVVEKNKAKGKISLAYFERAVDKNGAPTGDVTTKFLDLTDPATHVRVGAIRRVLNNALPQVQAAAQSDPMMVMQAASVSPEVRLLLKHADPPLYQKMLALEQQSKNQSVDNAVANAKATNPILQRLTNPALDEHISDLTKKVQVLMDQAEARKRKTGVPIGKMPGDTGQ